MEKKELGDYNSFQSKTNRHFYSRRKKSHLNQQPNMQKALKFLIKQSAPKKPILNRTHLKTQQGQCSFRQSTTINEISIIRKNIDLILQKLHSGWKLLLKAFDEIFQSNSMGKLQKAQLIFYHRFEQILINYSQSKKKFASPSKQIQFKEKSNRIFIQNIKLEKQNCLLRDSLSNLSHRPLPQRQNTCLSKQISEQEKSQIKILERKLSLKNQQNQILAKQLEFVREDIYTLRDDKKNLLQRIGELKIKNQNLCSQIISIQLKSRCHGSNKDKQQMIMMMQKQQVESYEREVRDQKKVYTSLLRKYNNLLAKFKKVRIDNNCKIAILYSRQAELFPEQISAFQQVRTKNIGLISKLHAETQKNRQKRSKQKPVMAYQPYLNAKQSVNNKQAVKKQSKSSYYYYYPTFYHLVAEPINFFGIDQNNYQHFNQKIKLSFLGTLRAIMDSKYNEFMMYQDHRQISSFPSFVYSWIHTFQIDNNKKVAKIQKKTFSSSKQTIALFYVNLMSEKLNSSWEIITFREFLLETFRADELYYYLGIRFYILEGDMMMTLDSCFQQIYYIDSLKAMHVIHKFIKDTDSEYLKIIQQFIKRGLVYFRKKSFIDMHLLLRIMLEYYQYKKQQYIEKIAQTVDTVTQNKKLKIDFTDFMKIVDYHLDYLSLTLKLELYRKCYCVGKGNITFQTLLTVFNSQHVFIYWIQKVIIGQDILIHDCMSANGDQNFKIQPNLQYLSIMEQKYRYIINAQFMRQSQHLGVQHFNCISDKKIPLNKANIHERFEDCFKLCLHICKKFYRSNLMNIEQMQQPLMTIIEFLSKFSRMTMQRKQIKQLKQHLRYQGACRKIVRFYQKKKVQMTHSIKMAYSSNNQMKDEDEEKNEILRTEFMNIITEVKNKNKQSSQRMLD